MQNLNNLLWLPKVIYHQLVVLYFSSNLDIYKYLAEIVVNLAKNVGKFSELILPELVSLQFASNQDCNRFLLVPSWL